jgi:hypothetical protein
VEGAAGNRGPYSDRFDPDRRTLTLLGARKAANLRHSDGTTGEKQRGKCILKLVKKSETPPEFSEGASAGWTGLEPAASGVTGRRYNQLNYHPMPEPLW